MGSGARPSGILPTLSKREVVQRRRGVFGGVSTQWWFLAPGGCSGVSGCAQGRGAGQPALVCINRLRLLAIRAAAAAPAGRGMLLFAERTWQPEGIAGKRSGHLTSRVLPG